MRFCTCPPAMCPSNINNRKCDVKGTINSSIKKCQIAPSFAEFYCRKKIILFATIEKLFLRRTKVGECWRDAFASRRSRWWQWKLIIRMVVVVVKRALVRAQCHWHDFVVRQYKRLRHAAQPPTPCWSWRCVILSIMAHHPRSSLLCEYNKRVRPSSGW